MIAEAVSIAEPSPNSCGHPLPSPKSVTSRKILTISRKTPPLGQTACKLEAKVRKLKPSPWKIGLSFGTAVAIHG
jgi:hypothetical protein